MKEQQPVRPKTNLRWLVLITVIIGTFLGSLDQTIIVLGLPKIILDFSITVTEASWISTAYILASAVFVPIWGKLGDTIGRRKVYILGFVIFIIGSFLAGLAWNLTSLIVFRVIQAVAASADLPTAMAIIVATFDDEKERAQALGLWSATFAAAIVVGPLLGGPLIDYFTWRSIFFINIPIGLIGVSMAFIFVKESKAEKQTIHFDWWGSLTLGVALATFVLVLEKGREWGWLSTESVMSYITTIVFAVIFYRIDSKHPEPVVDFAFFKNRAFNGALLDNFTCFMNLQGTLFLVPVFIQTFLGYTSSESGYLFLPMAVCMLIGAPIGSLLAEKVHPRFVICFSTMLSVIGFLLFTGLDFRSTAAEISISMAILALGIGIGLPQRTSIVASVVPEDEVGIASSVLALIRNIAGAFGIAVFATLLENTIENNVLNIAQNSVINSVDPFIRAQGIIMMILRAEILSYRYVFGVSAVILFIAAISVLFTLNVKITKSKTQVIIG